MRCSERRRVPRREANVRSTEIEVVKVNDRSWAGSRLSGPDGRDFRVATAPDPKPLDASVRYEEARTYNIAPCPLRARRVRPALTEVGSS